MNQFSVVFLRFAGHAGKSVGDEVKRVLTNNNASPAHKRTTSRHSRSSGGETSDDGSANIHKVGFPKDSDQRRLMDLVRSISNKSDSDSGSGHVTVKRVTSRHYGDTDSDSSSSSESDHEAQRSPLPRRGRESEPSSMPASRTDSVRSSIRSSSAVSSEQSTALVESEYSDHSMKDSPRRKINRNTSRPGSKTESLRSRKASDSVIENPSPSSSVMTDSRSTLNDSSYEGSNSRQGSVTRTGSKEFTVEHRTQVKFHRCSLYKKKRTSEGGKSCPWNCRCHVY